MHLRTVGAALRRYIAGRLVREGPPARIRLHTLILIRWAAIAGQLLTVLIVHYGFGFEFSLGPVVAAIAVSVLVNVASWLLTPRTLHLGDLGGLVFLGYDMMQLAALLALTGGLQNPFSLFLLVPMTISATFLSLRSTVVLCGLAIALSSIIANFHAPLPWRGEGLALPGLYTSGLWIALVIGLVFIAAYAWRVSSESRRMGDALSATQLALAQEQRVSALGALAAAAAHDLATPLATITLVVKELLRTLPDDSPMVNDIRLLHHEAQRCRALLAQLPRRGQESALEPREAVPLSTLVQSIAELHQRPGIRLGIDTAPSDTAPESMQPVLPQRAEFVHGLGNLVDNAMKFARSMVEIRVRWDDDEVVLTIADDGPGFPPAMIGLLGEPYLTRRKGAEGMGLGVFIAKTLLQRLGGVLGFSNRGVGGAQVSVWWPRKMIEHRDALAALGGKMPDIGMSMEKG